MPKCFEKYRCPRENSKWRTNGRPERLHIIVCYPKLHCIDCFLGFLVSMSMFKNLMNLSFHFFLNGGQNGGHFQNGRHERLELQIVILNITALTDFYAFGV